MECNVAELGYMKPRRGILEQDEVLAKDKYVIVLAFQSRLFLRLLVFVV
jgi:hypothetical protein